MSLWHKKELLEVEILTWSGQSNITTTLCFQTKQQITEEYPGRRGLSRDQPGQLQPPQRECRQRPQWRRRGQHERGWRK